MDRLLEKIGGFGLFQKKILLMTSLYSTMVAYVTFMSVFNNARPKLGCYNIADPNITLDEDESCKAWANINSSLFKCQFDKTYYGESIVTEWGLLCDPHKIYLAQLTKTLFMVGALCSFFSGYFSDRYGRRTVVLCNHSLLSISLVLCEVLQTEVFGFNSDIKYYIFLSVQFLLGLSSFTVYVVSFIILVEITHPKYVMRAKVIDVNCYGVGELLLLVVCYICRSWHYQFIFIGAYSIAVLILAFFILPESPKFLIANKRYEEAAEILTKVSKTNGNELKITANDIKIELNEKISESGMKLMPTREDTVENQFKTNKSVFYYLTHPITNSVKTVALAYLFVAFSMIYFGVGLGITMISSSFNPYLIFCFGAFAEMIGYTLCLSDKYISRKNIMCATTGIAGVFCLIVAVIPVDKESPFSFNAILVFSSATIGKIMCSAAFNIIYLYTAQFYPTGVRNTLVSFVMCAGRIGSLISPQINYLGIVVWKQLPYIVFSANAFLSSFIIFFMPDTASLKHDI